jgi:hypothetical protein
MSKGAENSQPPTKALPTPWGRLPAAEPATDPPRRRGRRPKSGEEA